MSDNADHLDDLQAKIDRLINERDALMGAPEKPEGAQAAIDDLSKQIDGLIHQREGLQLAEKPF